MSAGGILTVCDANVCRSVAAELFLAAGITEHPSLEGIEVFSSGVNAASGHSACRAVVGLRDDLAWKARASAHQPLQLDTDAIEYVDLILTATVQSRAAVVSQVPQARRKVFTLREALWLADPEQGRSETTELAPLRAFVEHLDRNRGLRPPPHQKKRLWRPSSHPFDILDGHLRSPREHAATLRQVENATTRIVQMLANDFSSDRVSTQAAADE